MIRSFYHRVVTQLLSGTRVFHVTGLKRSGNHACVYWLANALDQGDAGLSTVDGEINVYASRSGNVVFLNNVMETFTAGQYLQTLFKYRRLLRRAHTLIVSTEDVAPGADDYRIPAKASKIFVRRAMLNVLASRWELFSAQALTRNPRLRIDSYVLDLALAYQEAGGFVTWDYDRWLADAQYRAEFLRQYALQTDILPATTPQGRGSSFARASASDRAQRYRQTTLPAFMIQMLRDERYRSLLSDEECRYLDAC